MCLRGANYMARLYCLVATTGAVHTSADGTALARPLILSSCNIHHNSLNVAANKNKKRNLSISFWFCVWFSELTELNGFFGYWKNIGKGREMNGYLHFPSSKQKFKSTSSQSPRCQLRSCFPSSWITENIISIWWYK